MHAWIYLKSITKWAAIVGALLAAFDWLGPFRDLIRIEYGLAFGMVFAYGVEFVFRIIRAVIDGTQRDGTGVPSQLADAVTDWLALLVATGLILAFATVAANAFNQSLSPVAVFLRSTAFFGIFLLLAVNSVVLWFGSEEKARTFTNRLVRLAKAGKSQDLGEIVDAANDTATESGNS